MKFQGDFYSSIKSELQSKWIPFENCSRWDQTVILILPTKDIFSLNLHYFHPILSFRFYFLKIVKNLYFLYVNQSSWIFKEIFIPHLSLSFNCKWIPLGYCSRWDQKVILLLPCKDNLSLNLPESSPCFGFSLSFPW